MVEKNKNPTVAVKNVGSIDTDAHGTLTVYEFSSSNVEEQLVVYIIHNHETVAVTLKGVPNGDFQLYLEALKQVAASIRFRT